jgi:hypothetical protein
MASGGACGGLPLRAPLVALVECLQADAEQGERSEVPKFSDGASPARAHRILLQPRLSHAAMWDLRWWATLSSNVHVGREVWPAPSVAMFTDASMRGWGAIWNG